MKSQCFEGESRMDTPSWFIADTSQRRYVRKEKPRNEIRTETSECFYCNV